MALIRPNEPHFMTAVEAAQRRGYAGRAELALRNTLETFCRQRWPGARLCHEMVMGEGRVRADLVAVTDDHIVAFEIKAEYDDTTRLLHQVGMYQLCCPEVWIVVPVGRHAEDARVLKHLLPSLGLLVGAGKSDGNYYEFDGKDFLLTVEAEPSGFAPLPAMALQMLWRDELIRVCDRTGTGRASSRVRMIAKLIDLPFPVVQREICIELRGRNALWRADPAIEIASSQGILGG